MENRNLIQAINKERDKVECEFKCPLLKLNDYCFAEIFKYLGWKDARNFGESYERVRNLGSLRYKHISKFDISSEKLHRGDKFLDNILLDFGEHLRSLTICLYKVQYGEKDLRKVIKQCTNLKILEIQSWMLDTNFNRSEAASFFDGIEMLTLNKCNLAYMTAFFNCFSKLKFLNFYLCHDLCTKDVKMLFDNNTDIESFYLYGGDDFGGIDFHISDFELFQFGQKFDKLCLVSKPVSLEINSLLRLTTTNLTKLRIESIGSNINNLLIELARQGILEELQLQRVKIDLNSLKIIQLMKQLQLLVLTPDQRTELHSSGVWPPNLKQLQLSQEFTISSFISTIKQLKSLEIIDLEQSWILDDKLADVTKLSESILKVRSSQRRLDIILPCVYGKNICNLVSSLY